MTKEEAIKILTGYMGGKIDPESTELYHAIELVVDILESQPSLPSDLDEAAREYADESCFDDPEFTATMLAFKAGAEWLAEQGVSMIITDETKWAEVDKFVHSNCDGARKFKSERKTDMEALDKIYVRKDYLGDTYRLDATSWDSGGEQYIRKDALLEYLRKEYALVDFHLKAQDDPVWWGQRNVFQQVIDKLNSM